MNTMEIEYYIERYGLEDTAKRLATEHNGQVIQLHLAMIKTHEAALKELLLALAVDDLNEQGV